MAKVWCEYGSEFAFFDESEFASYKGVRVHMQKPWHTVNGEVIEMAADGTPVLEDGEVVFEEIEFDTADASDGWTSTEDGDTDG